MKKIIASILAFALLLSTCLLTAFADNERIVLTVTPSITESKSDKETDVVFTIKITPKSGVNVGAFSFTLEPDDGMTLSETKLAAAYKNQGGDGYWVASKDLKFSENEDTGETTGIFKTFEYTVASKYFAAAGATADNCLTKEAIVMTIKATIKAGKAAKYNLNIEGFAAADPLGKRIEGLTVENQGVDVKEPPVAVTGVTIDKTLSVKVGETLTPAYSVTPDNATNKKVTFKSDNTDVATVDSATGAVTGIKSGTANITVTTDDGKFTDTCKVTVDCPHKDVKDVPAEDSTCIKHGHEAYTVCNTCGKILKGSDKELKLAEHKYEKRAEEKHLKEVANCIRGAVYSESCSVCGKENGKTFESEDLNPDNHTGKTEVKNASASTCTKKGYTGDIYCKDCNAKLEDGKEIPLTAHTPSSDFKTDGDNHWKTCTVCKAEIEKEKHSGGEATCKDKAKCSACGKEYGDLNPDNHTGKTEVKNASASTCTKKGYTGDIYCKDCNAKLEDGKEIPLTAHTPSSDFKTDGDNHWKTCTVCKAEIEKEKHSGGEATCKDKAKCSVCGKEYGDLNSDNHKNTELQGYVSATEEKEGYSGNIHCLDCDKLIKKGSVLDRLEHKPELVKATEATAAKEGNKEYYFCKNCGKYYADEEGKEEIEAESVIIKKLAPQIINGNNAKFEKGSKEALMFRSDASFADFIRVELDGKELDAKNYTLKEGSIIVTLTPEFASTLSVGTHTLGIVSASGTAKTDFTVTETVKDNTSPKTGAERNNYTGLAVFVSVISLAVLGGTVIINKKKAR